MVLELERAERMRDPFERIGQRVRVVVHRVDAPGVCRCGGGSRAGSGRASDRACSSSATPCRSSPAARARRPGTRRRACGRTGRGSRRSADRGYGLFRPGSVRVPRWARISSAVRLSTYALSRSIRLDGERVQLLEVVRREQQRVPREAEPATSSLIASTYSTSSLVGFVSSKRRLQVPPRSSGHAEVQADRLRMADVQVAVGLGRKPRRHATVVLARTPDPLR